jgi:hypothetical protein
MEEPNSKELFDFAFELGIYLSIYLTIYQTNNIELFMLSNSLSNYLSM